MQSDSLGRDSRPVLRGIDRPIIFINRSGSGADAIEDILARELPAAQFAVMNDVGHVVFLDDAERFNELLTGFPKRIK